MQIKDGKSLEVFYANNCLTIYNSFRTLDQNFWIVEFEIVENEYK